MKKLLLTLMKSNRGIKRGLMSFLLLVSFNIIVTDAQITGVSQCDCLDNETFPGSGQFRGEVFVLSGVGESWSIVSSDGFYDFSLPNPNLAEYYPVGTPLIEGPSPGGSKYMLEGLHYSNSMWSVEVTNGSQILTIASSHTCAYPDKLIRGDKDVCLGDTEDYWINEPAGNITGLTWNLSSGGNLVGSGTKVRIEWDNVVGSHTLSVSGTGLDGCTIDNQVTVYIRDNESISLACNNVVNLAMNSSCVVNITPDMILEDMMLTEDAYEVVLRHVEVDTIIPNGIIDGTYIGVPIEATVIHECSGNSCWSTINIEDKSIPELECGLPDTLDCDMVIAPGLNDLPVPAGVIASYNGNDGFILEDFDYCGEAYLTYKDDVLSENLCTGPFSSIIERLWNVEDESGNSSACSQLIYIRRATLDDVTFPDTWDDVLGPRPSLPACGNFPTLPNGYPHPSYTGEPMGTFCLNVQISYIDVKLDACGDEAYKIKRQWKVYDLCSNDSESHDQLITVMDNEAPVCSAPAPYDINTDALDCGSNINVKKPTVTYECSEWSYYVSYRLLDENDNFITEATTDNVVFNPNIDEYIINNLPAGQSSVWIIYNFEDVCGNTSQCFTEVNIIDNVQPVPVCDLHTFVALNDEGYACVLPETFDDGSWDNCGIERIEAVRMDGNPCGLGGCPSGALKFCCADVGDIVMVRMTVWDYAGNSNNCMVEVEVQDNVEPVFTYCPPARTIDCGDLPISYGSFGTPTAEDACDFTITENVTENINECGVGTVRRLFTATDSQGNSSTCTQIISVEDLNPFTLNNIKFPSNITINGCRDTGTSPDDLDYPNDRPRIQHEACSQVAVTYVDQEFQYVDGACFKILRTWTVIDWCQYVPTPYPTPSNTQGKWTKQQIIKVFNNTAPTITQGCNNLSLSGTPNSICEILVDLSAEATDDCTDEENLIWSYTVDLQNDGSINKTGATNNINGYYPSGVHKITWTVTDDCNNETTCMQVITINDDKDPTPYCLTGIVSVMPESGVLEIWASDFDNGSFDSCPDDANVTVAFSSNPTDKFKTFTCDDLTGAVDTIDLRMYVIDNEGNYDYCETMFIIQDNKDVCPDVIDTTSSLVTVAGSIYTEDNEMLSNVDVMLMASNAESEKHNMTDNGGFAFQDLAMHNDFMLEPSKDDNYMSGISTLDLVLIQRHILKLKKFDSPYKIIAADINNSGNISAIDLIHLRKLILGKTTSFENNNSWRFVDAKYEFEDNNDPFPFAEQVNISNLDQNTMHNDFVAVKIGDVNNSFNFDNEITSDNRNQSEKAFYYEESMKDDVLNLSIMASAELQSLEGFQTTITFDPSKYTFINHKATNLLLTAQNLNVELAERGIITLSYSEAINIFDFDNSLFELEFKVNNNSNSTISFSSDEISSEVYINNGDKIETFELTLNPKFNTLNTNTFELYKNIPNPFSEITKISFNLPTDNEVQISVFDLNGKEVYQATGNYNQGMNEIIIDANNINASGVLYYQLKTAESTLGNKMILIK